MASRMDFYLPDRLTAEQQSKFDRLSALSGATFDRAYMRMMVMDHEKTVQDFRLQANSGRNDDLRDWAADKVPVVRH